MYILLCNMYRDGIAAVKDCVEDMKLKLQGTTTRVVSQVVSLSLSLYLSFSLSLSLFLSLSLSLKSLSGHVTSVYSFAVVVDKLGEGKEERASYT